MARSSIFSIHHPLVTLAYFLAVVVFCMAVLQPLYVFISLGVALCFGVAVRGFHAVGMTLLWQLAFVIVIACVNAFFTARGSTELFRVGTHGIYRESLIYGLTMGLMLVAALQWFTNAAAVLSADRVLALIGGGLPTVGLMVSMTLRLVPQFVRRGKLIREVEAVNGENASGIGSLARESTTLMAWAMEDSLETADAMRARGWGATPKRSRYRPFRFRLRDGLALGFLVALVGLNVPLAGQALSTWAFYPAMPALGFEWRYVPYIIMLALPLWLRLLESRRWVR